jgi:hypothetical protein
MHACWRVARVSFRRRDGAVMLSASVKRELGWWLEHLQADVVEGVPLAKIGMPRSEGDWSAVYADASGSIGFMAWTLAGSVVLFVEGVWDERERGMDIAVLELLASTFGLVALAPFMTNRVVSFTDNVVAQAAMRAAAPRAEMMQRVAAARTEWLLTAGVAETTRRITTHNNVWADAGSRGKMCSVVVQAERLGFEVVRVQVPGVWRETSEWV